MGAMRACRRYTGAPGWKFPSPFLCPFAATSRKGRWFGSDARSSFQEEHRLLWKNIFSNHSVRWDDKLQKRGYGPADFVHKLRQEQLWLNNRYKYIWVKTSGLATLGTQLQRSEKRHPQEPLAGGSCDEILSPCNEGPLERAIDVLLRVDQQNTVPSVNAYRSLLNTCAKAKSLAQAKQVHVHLAKHGLESNSFLGEYTVSTFVKCGGLADALQVFRRLPQPSVFSWTAVISGYSKFGRGKEALRMYEQMQKAGVEPNVYTFVSLLKACGSIADLDEGKRIHVDALKYKCAADLFVRTCLVDMYGKCGSMVDAQNVFYSFPHRDEVSWNAMLAAYAQQGEAERALELYEQMRQEGVIVTERTFVSALQACSMLAEKEADVLMNGHLTKARSLAKGKAIHAEIWRGNYCSNVFIGSTLIGMYGKVGSIVDAQKVFAELSLRNIVSWNAMLAAYVHQGQAGKALQLFQIIWEEGVSPNVQTFSSTIQACGMCAEQEENVLNWSSTKAKLMKQGKVLHEIACIRGYDSIVSFGNTLISMYGRCGSILDAQNSFDGLCERDMVSWNTILAVYVQDGQAEKVLQLYEQMLVEGINSDIRTCISILQACQLLAENERGISLDGQSTKLESVHRGMAIHADVWRKGYESEVFIASTLVDMYGKCGSLLGAQNVFDVLTEKNVVAWTAMLAAYVEQGQAEEALQLYEQMWEVGVSPNDRTFVCALQAAGLLSENEPGVVLDGQTTKVNSLEKGRAIHGKAWRKGYDSDVFVGNTLVSMYGKCGSIVDAHSVFDTLSECNVVAWTAILAAYAQHGEAEKALQIYQRMVEEGVSPDARTFASTLLACGMLAEKEDAVVDGRSTKAMFLEMGKAIHSDAKRKGYHTDAFVGNSLLSMYGKFGSISDTQDVFQGLLHRDRVSWNVMLNSYAQQGQWEKTIKLYQQMKEEGVSPDDITIMCALQACSNTGSLNVCRQIEHSLLSCKRKPSCLVMNTLIHAYGRCASMVDAQAVFNALSQHDVVSWNALIAGYSRRGDSAASLHLYEEMQQAGFKPNGVTFLSVLSACSHAGLLDEGIRFFESMQNDHGITPDIEHYVGMADLIGRAGYFRKVEKLLSDMPMQPNLALWMCLLGACQKHGEVVLGKRAFDCAVQIEPRRSAAYVIMRNIYADAGLWDSAKEVNELRQKQGAWKKPGQTWIEYDLEVHTFTAGDAKLLAGSTAYAWPSVV